MNKAKKRVVFYPRVSTKHEMQMEAFEYQLQWYEQLLSKHPEWNLVKPVKYYMDKGITGTSTKKRKGFNQMMEDAENKEFDLIVTREVCRFARNTVDTLNCCRLLKDYAIEVYFHDDDIWSLDEEGEYRLTMMAANAQEESRRTSRRVRNGQEVSRLNGVPYGNGNILGYDRVGRGEFVINEEQAKTVRTIFELYNSGVGMRSMQWELEARGCKRSSGLQTWTPSVISRILHNSFYCGIIEYNKSYVDSYLKQSRIKNNGEKEVLKKIGTHPAIISVEEFERTQEILSSRGRGKNGRVVKQSKDIWCKKLECSCGASFRKQKWHKTDNGIQCGYLCSKRLSHGSTETRRKKELDTSDCCDTKQVADYKLDMMANYILKQLKLDKDSIIKIAMDILRSSVEKQDTNYDNSRISALESEVEKKKKMLSKLIDTWLEIELEPELFTQKKNEINKEIEELNKHIEEIGKPVKTINVTDRLNELKSLLDRMIAFESINDTEKIIDAVVEKVVVDNNGFKWYLRNGGEIVKLNVNGSRNKPNLYVFDSDTTGSVEQLGSIQIASYILNEKYARRYQKEHNMRRLYAWQDLKLDIYF